LPPVEDRQLAAKSMDGPLSSKQTPNMSPRCGPPSRAGESEATATTHSEVSRRFSAKTEFPPVVNNLAYLYAERLGELCDVAGRRRSLRFRERGSPKTTVILLKYGRNSPGGIAWSAPRMETGTTGTGKRRA
jgi:hypothetical protein